MCSGIKGRIVVREEAGSGRNSSTSSWRSAPATDSKSVFVSYRGVTMGEVFRVASEHKPEKLVSLVREKGNDTFAIKLDTLDEEIFNLLPNVSRFGYEVSHKSGVMLANLVCVEPHTDPSVGRLDTSHAVFGLLSGGKNLQLFVRDNDEWVITRMRPGDWVLFEDHKEHMVLADTKWTGIAVQVKKLTA